MIIYSETATPGAHIALAQERGFLAASALLFVASAAATVYWCTGMSGGMPMPGGWTMSMAWMRMPGQSWLGAAGSFTGMWLVMMIAMMLPSLVPSLSVYRRSIRGSGQTSPAWLTALVSAGYFFTWTVFGAAAYSTALVLVAAEMRWPVLSRSVPIVIGAVLLLAGFVQLTAWKAHELARCRNASACGPSLSPGARNAWAHGLRLGVHCCLCCSGFMMLLLVTGVMSLNAMTIVAAAITVERLAPRPKRAARVTGVVIIAAGVLVVARALRLT
jgi:predicted metal-binding membrane protein